MMEGALFQWAEDTEELYKTLKSKLNIITGEALNSIKNSLFKVRIKKSAVNDEIDFEKCFCGPSYAEKNKWSKCTEIFNDGGYVTLSFAPGEWLEDAVPCFTDLYMIIFDNSGNKYAGTVKIKIN